jgi:hypothetical protein
MAIGKGIDHKKNNCIQLIYQGNNISIGNAPTEMDTMITHTEYLPIVKKITTKGMNIKKPHHQGHHGHEGSQR